MLQEEGDMDQERMVQLAEEGINDIRIRGGSYSKLLYTACHHGAFDLVLYLLKNRGNSMSGGDIKIVILYYEYYRMQGLWASNPEKATELKEKVRAFPCFIPEWEEQIKPWVQSPDKLSEYCKIIDEWMMPTPETEWQECPPSLQAVFIIPSLV
jgi:hypothetical protein